MWQLPQQPLTMQQVVAEAYALFKEAFFKQWIILSLFLILLAIPYWVTPLIDTEWKPYFQTHYHFKTGSLLALYIIGLFFLLAAFYRQLQSIMHNQFLSSKHSLWFALKILPSLIIAFVVAAITNVISWLLLVVPGIYILLVIQLYYPLIIIDDIGPFTGCRRILQLVWGNWWRTAVVLIVPIVISFFLMLGLEIILFIISAIFQPPVPVLNILQIYIQIISAALFLPISAVINSMQIHNLKLRKSAVLSEPPQVKLHIVNG